jgi:hypothetical protein
VKIHFKKIGGHKSKMAKRGIRLPLCGNLALSVSCLTVVIISTTQGLSMVE